MKLGTLLTRVQDSTNAITQTNVMAKDGALNGDGAKELPDQPRAATTITMRHLVPTNVPRRTTVIIKTETIIATDKEPALHGDGAKALPDDRSIQTSINSLYFKLGSWILDMGY
jgi:hypothetical protein